MPTLRFSLNLSAEDYLNHYRGVARRVVARAHDGRTLEFPSHLLQRFVTHHGIRGEFEILLDDNNKLLEIRRCAESS